MTQPGERLRSALPPEAVDQVLKEVDSAHARQLPAGALEHRALELAARGASASDIIHEITVYHRLLWLGREALRAGRRAAPSDDEIESASAVLRLGVGEEAIGLLAAVTPGERSLAGPLAVVSSLMSRGLPATDVIAAMRVWLESGATDAELHDLAGPAADPLPGPPPRPKLTVIRTERTVR